MQSVERHIPRQVDAWKLVNQSASLQGYLSLGELPRFAAALAAVDPAQQVVAGLLFGRDDEGHRVVTGQLKTSVPLICQRCLEQMTHVIDTSIAWGLLAVDDEARKLPAALDPVVIDHESGQLDLHAMLEDELLLNLPISAFHDSCEGDGSPRGFGDVDAETATVTQKPFAGLADLLKK